MVELQDIFNDFEKHLMNDKKPSIYFNRIFSEKSISKKYPLTMLSILKKIEQSPKHHAEGNVWNHTMLVVDKAAVRKNHSKNPRAFMWAALLHDIGKAPATKIRKGRITAYDHDKYGEELAIAFLEEFEVDNDFIYDVSKMIRWHMQTLYVVKNLPYANIEKMLEETNLIDISLLCLCDRLGRGNMTKDKITEEEQNIKIFIKKCKEFMD